MNYNKRDFKSRRSFGSSAPKSGNFSSNTHKRSFNGGYSRANFQNKRKNPYRDEYIDNEMFISKAVENRSESVYESGQTFDDFKLNNSLLNNILKHKYVHPTKIQSSVIEPIMARKDILGLATTGSGKTGAYLIPIVNMLLSEGQKGTKRCLVVAPTRDLINQISAEFRQFAQNTFLRDVLVVGGASYSTQIRVLQRDPHIVLATPGRLLDLYTQKHIDLSKFDVVVLDEVDQMLDMGFIHDIKQIISSLKSPRQSLFFSATLTSKIKDVATSLLNNPVSVDLSETRAVKNVDQDIVKVGPKNKMEVLHEILVNAETSRVLVFSRTKHGADLIADDLKKRGHKADSLHGNKSLGKRIRVLSMFRNFEIEVLVATDVASRGIDIPDISHVINFDKPATYQDYIHRIGRTGRIGKKGTALTFV